MDRVPEGLVGYTNMVLVDMGTTNPMKWNMATSLSDQRLASNDRESLLVSYVSTPFDRLITIGLSLRVCMDL